MLVSILKTFSIIICGIYAYQKIVAFRLNQFSKTQYVLITILLTILSAPLTYFRIDFAQFWPAILFWVIASCKTTSPQKTFITTTISFTLSFVTHSLACFPSTILVYILFPNKKEFPFLIVSTISCMLQILGVYLLCKIKRLQKGMPFLSRYKTLNIVTIICLLLAAFSTYMSDNYLTYELRRPAFFIILSVLAFLIYWWQAQITKSYRRSLELRELESIRTENMELKVKLQEVLEENERLARITHRDNTLITALKNSTINYLCTDFENSDEAIAQRDMLIQNINALSEGRVSLSRTCGEKKPRDFDTNLTLLNELLHEMDANAIENGIDFAVHMGITLDDFVPSDISESDLVHTVDDLLKNAFKACMQHDKRNVQLQFYKFEKHLVIEIADSGIPFEVKSLVNMGIEKLTTYEDGSGIGLMDIWSTKEKYRATYHLEEYTIAAPFSKKISITFDKKNRFSIRSLRKDEILQMSRRADLQVYGESE